MKTHTHTNGPWKAYLYGKDAHGRTIATVGANDGNNRICEISPYDLPLSDVAANARLISAAPDLLAALQAVLSTYRTFRNVPKDLQEWTCIDDEAFEQGLSAIAKAKGDE